MLQRLTITTEETARLKPLLEVAIQNEAKLLAHGVQRTSDKLRQFEQRFGFTSEAFERKFSAGELPETLDFIEWAGEIKMLHILEGQQRALAGARIVDCRVFSVRAAHLAGFALREVAQRHLRSPQFDRWLHSR